MQPIRCLSTGQRVCSLYAMSVPDSAYAARRRTAIAPTWTSPSLRGLRHCGSVIRYVSTGNRVCRA
eukprot:1645912-Rhodomonas_salina.1